MIIKAQHVVWLTDSQKLQEDLLKVEQLETKITDELRSLKEKIDRMEDELVIYSDLEQLKQDADDKKKVRVYFRNAVVCKPRFENVVDFFLGYLNIMWDRYVKHNI